MKLKNEKEALQMFCDQDGWRDGFQSPFINDKDNGQVLATDRRIVAIVDSRLLRCKYKHSEQRMPNYDYQREDFRRVIEFSNFDEAYNQLSLIPEKKSKDGKPKECPECGGSGEVEYEYTDSDGNTHYKDCDCPICDGTGERDDYELVETGRMILSENCTFGLGDQIIDAHLMTRVVTALRKMGFERMTWKSTQSGAANFFDVCEGFIVVVMARLEKGDEHVVIDLDEDRQNKLMKASECKCCKCGKQAVAFWPVCDPDIPPYPYCRECLDNEKRELMIKLTEIDKKYNR